MRHFGKHPVHPALVHFPIAFWTAVPILDGMQLWTRNRLWWQCAFSCIAIGVVTALIAMAAGFVDLIALPAEHPAQATAQRHMLFVASSWCMFCVDLLLHSLRHEPTRLEVWLSFGASLLGFILLCTGGYVGAQLVYNFGVGQRTEHSKNSGL
jgi:uncharacterized membrane protein